MQVPIDNLSWLLPAWHMLLLDQFSSKGCLSAWTLLSYKPPDSGYHKA